MPYALKKLDLRKYDLIISCESGQPKELLRVKNHFMFVIAILQCDTYMI